MWLKLLAILAAGSFAHAPVAAADAGAAGRSGTLRVATFNASLTRRSAGALVRDLAGGAEPQARAVAEIVQRVAPDVLLVNELDYDGAGRAATIFREEYLAVGRNEARPIEFPHVFLAPVNTGVPSGLDLDHDGRRDGPGDAFGFGRFEGQYGMLVLSRHPILTKKVRTFRQFLWKDMPDALLPDDLETPAPADWFTPAELERVRLSSKSHWDLPIDVDGTIVHLLASHPTPPVFDGPEDRNGRRNHDEIRFWRDYVTPDRSDYVYDDAGVSGGLAPGVAFVILGDLNADPVDGDGIAGAAAQLLGHPRVNTTLTPSSLGGAEQSIAQGGVNVRHRGDPVFDTADFADRVAGNLRVDYVLPSRDLTPTVAGVFWPRSGAPHFELIGVSDHRLLWVDLELPRAPEGPD